MPSKNPTVTEIRKAMAVIKRANKAQKSKSKEAKKRKSKSSKKRKSRKSRSKSGTINYTPEQLDNMLAEGTPYEIFVATCKTATTDSIRAWAQSRNYYIDPSSKNIDKLCQMIYYTQPFPLAQQQNLEKEDSSRPPEVSDTLWREDPRRLLLEDSYANRDFVQFKRACANSPKGRVHTFAKRQNLKLDRKSPHREMCDALEYYRNGQP
jgi:hypothetical protein